MADEKNNREELTIKFAKGLADDFTGKDGKAYKRIRIPNADPEDHSPWASFVLPAKAVHENQYGKGLWAKIPADGHTVITKAERTDGVDGEAVWENRRISVSNRELKELVEAYKGRSTREKEAESGESVKEKLDSLAKGNTAKGPPMKKKALAKDR
ncbi:MAG: hypothetical protein K5852_09035 [Eubacterium sp.]|nr:hypothetical protein [Eubacterium sp.]